MPPKKEVKQEKVLLGTCCTGQMEELGLTPHRKTRQQLEKWDCMSGLNVRALRVHSDQSLIGRRSALPT